MTRTCILALILLLAFPALATGQDCTIAAYLDPAGTISHGPPGYDWGPYGVWLWEFSVYVVIFTEDTAAAASYSMTFDTTPDGPFLQARFPGPSGGGLIIDEPTGTNVALAECVIGFGGVPVLVDEYEFVVVDSGCPIFRCSWPGATFRIGSNASQDPDYPQYVNCNDVTKDCAVGPDLEVVNGEVSTESRSFGAVKSLYLGN